MTVYVLHIEPPYRHARHYVGYTPDEDAARRVDEHLSGNGKASPLIRAAIAVGCRVTVAHVFAGAGRDFERNLKARKDVRSWCPACGVMCRPLPDPARMSAGFVEAKPDYPLPDD